MSFHIHIIWISFISIFDPFYPPGEPISQHLLRFSELAVINHSFARKASHLPQAQLVNKTGEPGLGCVGLTASTALQLIRGRLLQLHESLPCPYCNLGP